MSASSGAPPSATPVAPEKRCPICGKPAIATMRPFCSKRCTDVDLNRWLRGVYAVPATPDDDDEDSDPVAGG